MGVFDFTATETQEPPDDQKDILSVINHGNSFRMTIPNRIATNHDINAADKLLVEETEKGFRVEVIDI